MPALFCRLALNWRHAPPPHDAAPCCVGSHARPLAFPLGAVLVESAHADERSEATAKRRNPIQPSDSMEDHTIIRRRQRLRGRRIRPAIGMVRDPPPVSYSKRGKIRMACAPYVLLAEHVF